MTFKVQSLDHAKVLIREYLDNLSPFKLPGAPIADYTFYTNSLQGLSQVIKDLSKQVYSFRATCEGQESSFILRIDNKTYHSMSDKLEAAAAMSVAKAIMEAKNEA